MEDLLSPITKTAVLCSRSSELSTFIWVAKNEIKIIHLRVLREPVASLMYTLLYRLRVKMLRAMTGGQPEVILLAKKKKKGDWDALENGNRVQGGLRNPGIIPSELQTDRY